jgi:hypothetical protein
MWLTACPAESEQPGTEINHIQKQQSLRKKPLIKKNQRENLNGRILLCYKFPAQSKAQA